MIRVSDMKDAGPDPELGVTPVQALAAVITEGLEKAITRALAAK